jgi:thiamine kinase-like enzyme
VPAAVRLRPRTPASSIEELLAGATSREAFAQTDGKSGSSLDRVVIDGERFVLKQVHPDDDWTMRCMGDLGCRPARMWTSGLLDAVPEVIDHAVVGVATGLGRNGWGGALLLHDRSDAMVPEGDAPITLELHRQLLDHLAALSAPFWGAPEVIPGLVDLENRWSFFAPGLSEAEAGLGWPTPIPVVARDGWVRFAERAPGDVARLVDDLRHDVDPLVTAVRRTPQTFLHGDWKLGNLGAADGRTILLDWTYPGMGPVAHDLAWYLALNQARLPEAKEDAIDALRTSLEAREVATDGWWEPQVGLCLLGALVQFGWEKALGDDDELGWWCERAREGARWLT